MTEINRGLLARGTMNRAGRIKLAAVFAALVTTLAACSGGDADAYPIRPTQEFVTRGKPIYDLRCSSCHGDVRTRPPLASAPTHQADGHTWHHPDRLLVEWVLDGVPLAKTMPKWRGQLSEEDTRAVIAYIKTFWPTNVLEQQIRSSVEYEAQLKEDAR